jgi:hypothetical protein
MPIAIGLLANDALLYFYLMSLTFAFFAHFAVKNVFSSQWRSIAFSPYAFNLCVLCALCGKNVFLFNKNAFIISQS